MHLFAKFIHVRIVFLTPNCSREGGSTNCVRNMSEVIPGGHQEEEPGVSKKVHRNSIEKVHILKY